MKWFKDNWLLLVLAAVVAFVLWRQFGSSSLLEKLVDQYDAQAEAFGKTIADLEEENARAKKAQEELNKAYEENMQRMEREYHESLEALELRRQQSIKKLVKNAEEDPTTITKAIQGMFNIPVHEAKK